MLTELAIRDLGVVADLRVSIGPGMTAVTGETGAGKTMLVEAIELLVGGRADAVLVRAGAAEAWVEGRFVAGDEEVVLARAVPASGRSRAYVDGRMAPVSALAEAGARLVDLHGQHAHQSLLLPAAQRAALDTYAGVEHAPLVAARLRQRELDTALVELGGDARGRAREAELLRFQVGEIDGAALGDPDEDAGLEAEVDRLADVTASREAAA
ncbi:MAG: AAA family ATPase, partial [Acidimicrobiales bacterium]